MTTTELLPTHATWVPTKHTVALHRELSLALDRAGIARVDGQYGLGKTTEVLRWARAQATPHIYIQLDPEALPQAVDLEILTLLDEKPCSHRQYEIKRQTRQRLSQEPLIVITDEAGEARQGVLRRLRTFHDKGDATWTWILTGTGTTANLQRLGGLPGRANWKKTMRPLEGQDLFRWARAFHPALASYTDNMLTQIDGCIAQGDDYFPGSLRGWSMLMIKAEEDGVTTSMSLRQLQDALGRLLDL